MTSKPLGLILAGGLARRMGGGDKGLIKIGGETILDRALSRMKPQCSRMIINANGDPSRFAFTGLPVVPDDIPDFAGPLAWHPRRPRLGGEERAGGGICCECAGRLSVSATRSPHAAGRRPLERRTPPRLRKIRRLAASSGWPLAGRTTRGPASRADSRKSAQD
jgi:hypothetical protein